MMIEKNPLLIEKIQHVLEGKTLSDTFIDALINDFYHDDFAYYGTHIVDAWNNTQKTPEEKFIHYLQFIIRLPPLLAQKIAVSSAITPNDILLDQLSNLYGVLTYGPAKDLFALDFAEQLVSSFRASGLELPADQTHAIESFLLLNTKEFHADRTNRVNQRFVQAVIQFNQLDHISAQMQLGAQKYIIWEFMNAFNVHRATYSMMRIEHAHPHTFSDAEIEQLRTISTQTAELYAEGVASQEWNLMLTHYFRTGEGLDKLQEKYQQHPEKHKGFNDDLEKIGLDLWSNPGIQL